MWINCDCGQRHLLFEAGVGLLFADDSPRLWRVASPWLLDAWVTVATDQPGKAVTLKAGTLLRYDQRDYDSMCRHEGWDRFRVLDGDLAETCVFIMVGMPGSPVSEGLEPVSSR